MRHCYTLFTVGLGLLLNLSACSTDTKSETRASRQQQPASAADTAIIDSNTDPKHQQSANAGDAPDTETGRLRNTVLAPAPEPAADPALVVSARARRKLAHLMRRQERAAAKAALATSAAATPAETAPATAAPATTTGALPAGNLGATPAAPADGPKAAQVFRIRPDRDTVLYGAEGTVMRVPAGTFVQDNVRQGGASDGLVEIRLREFYSMADILLERLSTMAGPRLLETGGMVQLSAATADGRECKLKPGSEFELGFPAIRPIDGMQLYNGRNTATHGLNWKLAPRSEATKSPKRFISWQYWKKPRIKGGYAVARHRLSKSIDYDATTAMRLNGYQAPGQLRRELRRDHKRVPVVGRVNASFELSETGQLNDVYFRKSGLPADSALQAAVVQALRRLKVSPASHGVRNNRRATRSLMKVDVRFTADRRVLVDHLRWDQATTIALFRADEERKATGRGRLTNTQLQAAPLEAVTGELFKRRTSNKRYSLGTYLRDQLNYTKELAVFPVKAAVGSNGLGWYNCDRPVPPPGDITKLALVRLGLEQPSIYPADVSLVLRDRRSVLRGNASGERVMFEQLVSNSAGTLIAIRREQGQLYLGLRDVVVSQRVEPPLEFRPVTVEELRAAVARFDL
ncbi:hypothetical protein [Hymenobacter mellowenesis]|nr:hypothetical protein [Hymenobacter sp. M29]